ncbi:hypothetical protein [Paenibacillus sp. DMB5]|uniref:hypothetical protein n=1 Tax=Paenibacillus sp. DMB5 TaxID=1780103 RepID=UPI0018E36D47|nr:hypothetical protein [Paenibacillus sp. DMB5]
MARLLQELDQQQQLSSLMYREIMLTRIRTGLSFDAACCTTVDPQTLLTTGAITEQGLERIHGALLTMNTCMTTIISSQSWPALTQQFPRYGKPQAAGRS